MVLLKGLRSSKSETGPSGWLILWEMLKRWTRRLEVVLVKATGLEDSDGVTSVWTTELWKRK